MFSRNRRGERRVSPPVYKLLLAAHVVVSSVWLGVAAAMLILILVATSEASSALYTAMEAINVAFPPAAVGTLVTGILLSLGTKWGLLRHYWVATKLLLAVGVIATGPTLMDRMIQQSVSASSGPAVMGGPTTEVVSAPVTLLISLSIAHVLMLGVATVLAVYKPWGKTRFGLPGPMAQPSPEAEILVSNITKNRQGR